MKGATVKIARHCFEVSILLLMINCLTQCTGEKKPLQDLAAHREDDSVLGRIRKARWVEDVVTVDSIRLVIPPRFTVGRINYVHIAATGDIFLTDTMISNAVLRFDRRGRFLGQLGKRGKGPGEYLMPKHVLTVSNRIFVSDVGLRRVSVYDTSGAFLHSFYTEGLLDGIYVGVNNTVVTHQLRVPAPDWPTIHVYSQEGELQAQFGRPSKLYRTFQSLARNSFGPCLARLNDVYYQIDYTDYHVAAYSEYGQLLQVFGVQPEQYRSLLSVPAERIPRAKYVTPEYIKKLNRFLDQYLMKCSLVDGILAFPPGLLATFVVNPSKTGFKNRMYLNFYSELGDLVRNDLPFKHYEGNFLLSPPDKIIQYSIHTESDSSHQTIDFAILTLRRARFVENQTQVP